MMIEMVKEVEMMVVTMYLSMSSIVYTCVTLACNNTLVQQGYTDHGRLPGSDYHPRSHAPTSYTAVET